MRLGKCVKNPNQIKIKIKELIRTEENKFKKKYFFFNELQVLQLLKPLLYWVDESETRVPEVQYPDKVSGPYEISLINQ